MNLNLLATAINKVIEREIANSPFSDTLVINGKKVIERNGVYHTESLSFRPVSFQSFFLDLQDAGILSLRPYEIEKVTAQYLKLSDGYKKKLQCMTAGTGIEIYNDFIRINNIDELIKYTN
ncbi:MAG: hypothetical protein JXB19_01780 [Bacteroidales bacterium]|nr:hypothetical protein [Bacteroidales bacterium]